ncbi:MAG TPA: prolyl oligopeptidase family serine peptidase, partial [Taishania sp.]|nr:prolyl oligopeptidase family serine peptidase [Taishania sp.]
YHLIDANNANAEPKIFLNRVHEHEYHVNFHNEGFYILTNHNAPNYKLVFSKEIPKNITDCIEILPHQADRLIENVEVTHNYIFVEERSNGLNQIRIMNLQTKQADFIKIDEETYAVSLYNTADYNTNTIKYRYNSMTTPSSIFEIDLTSGLKKQVYQYELLDKTFTPSDFESKRVWATAKDGTKVPISIVYKKGINLSEAPCFFYGYGSYGYTLPDIFSATRLSLLNRGFVYAQAHIRGEKYLGEEWYQQGKFLNKKNTFTDFIAAAEFLGANGYCDASRIYTNGGSAGGLLMGAVVNMAPQLFKAVIANVPFVDVVTTMLDETIPLTVGEYEEWGNPNDETYYHYMLSYSPYDNVQKMDYPHMLITTGYHDSQVQYWEPLKWIAKLREYRTNNNLLLLDCNMDAGHGGGSGRSTERYELAKMFAFILNLESQK